MVRAVGTFIRRGVTDPTAPHSDLVPLGFGPNIYVNPDEPVSPFDCERWPESPYCGGNPFSRDFMDLGVEMVRDDCNIGIDLQVTLGFVKFPHFQAVWRAPQCRGKEAQPPPPSGSFSSWENFPRLAASTTVTMFVGASQCQWYLSALGGTKCEKRWTSANKNGSRWEGEKSATYSDAPSFSKYYSSGVLESREGVALYEGRFQAWDSSNMGRVWMALMWAGVRNTDYDSQRVTGPIILRGRYDQCLYFLNIYRLYYEDIMVKQMASEKKGITPLKLYCDFIFPENPEPVKTAPPLPPRKPCCMSCCNSPKEKQNEDLLKLILKRVNDLHKKVGETDLPASVPANLSDASKGVVKIQNLAHFNAYIVKQLDAVTGQYPIEIKIKDTDLTKEGNQTQTIKLPNQAEAIAEMFGICMATKIETDAILKAVLRCLIDSGSHKSTSIQTYYLVKGISEFLAYKAKQKVVKIPFAFTPGETTTDKVLKEKEVEIKVVENADEDDLKDALAPLLEFAAMWKSQNFRKVNPKDAKADILRILRQIGAVADDLGSGSGGSAEQDFDTFLEKVERGWTGEPGASDTEHPYGRAYDERPRIRELGTSGDQDTGSP